MRVSEVWSFGLCRLVPAYQLFVHVDEKLVSCPVQFSRFALLICSLIDSVETRPMADTVAKKKSTATQILIGGVLIITGLYVICLIGLTLAQRSLLYFPCKSPWKNGQAVAAKRGFQVWTNSRGEFIGWLRPSSNPE